MSRVILQPAGGRDAQIHYRDTIVNPVPLEPNRDVLGDQYDALLEPFPDGRAAMWGVVPGVAGRNIRLYDDAAVGDLVLFGGNNRFFATGTLAYKWHNPALAERLWGIDDEGATWEFMYALDEVRGIDVPYVEYLLSPVAFDAPITPSYHRQQARNSSSLAI